MIEESENNTAKGELLRADHLFHVTLKYTRTADVIKNIIKRLLSTLDYALLDLLKKKKIRMKFDSSVDICRYLEKKYPKDKVIRELTEFYCLLNEVDKAKYSVREEYRKHVTLMTPVMDINIVKLNEFFDRTKEFLEYIEEL